MPKCKTCRDVVNGAMGIAKSTLHIDRATDREYERRLAVCNECERVIRCRYNNNPTCRCGECGCWLHHKARIRGEQCPLGYWQRDDEV